MELRTYYDKKVRIVTTHGVTYSGTVGDYFFPDDNESNIESIVIDTLDGDIVELTKEDIETITVL